MKPVPTQLKVIGARERRLRDRLIDLAVEAEGDANRLRNAGGVCMQHSETVSRCAWAIARVAYLIGGNHTDLTAFFPGVGAGRRDADAPSHGQELEEETSDGQR